MCVFLRWRINYKLSLFLKVVNWLPQLLWLRGRYFGLRTDFWSKLLLIYGVLCRDAWSQRHQLCFLKAIFRVSFLSFCVQTKLETVNFTWLNCIDFNGLLNYVSYGFYSSYLRALCWACDLKMARLFSFNWWDWHIGRWSVRSRFSFNPDRRWMFAHHWFSFKYFRVRLAFVVQLF